MVNVGETIPILEMLNYSMSQMRFVANELFKETNDPTYQLDQRQHNAYIESFLVHARNMANFITGHGGNKHASYNDLLYKDGHSIWRDIVKDGHKDYFENLSERISNRLAHFTKNIDKQQWEYGEIIERISSLLQQLEEIRKKHPYK